WVDRVQTRKDRVGWAGCQLRAGWFAPFPAPRVRRTGPPRSGREGASGAGRADRQEHGCDSGEDHEDAERVAAEEGVAEAERETEDPEIAGDPCEGDPGAGAG